MAEFRGVYPAGELVPAACGILSVARVTEHTESDERWLQNFSYEFDSQPSFVRLLTVDDASVSNGQLSDNQSDQRYADYQPFYIDVEDFASTFGLLGQDRFERVVNQLNTVTQKAVEFEYWDGNAAKADATGNFYLSKAATATVPNAGAFAPNISLMYLEQAIADSPVGEGGVIHMTRDIASILGSRLIYKKGEDEYSGRAMTRLGTHVVIGSGYSGNGPVGATGATASATNKWMYATGPVNVHLGKIEVVNDNLAQGADVTINNMRIKAYRPAAVYSDPSLHYAMRVTIPTT